MPNPFKNREIDWAVEQYRRPEKNGKSQTGRNDRADAGSASNPTKTSAQKEQMYWEQLDRLLSPKFFEQFLEKERGSRRQYRVDTLPPGLGIKTQGVSAAVDPEQLLSPKFFEQLLENATAKRNQKKQELWDYTRDFALHGSPSYQPQGTSFGNGVVFGEDLAAQNAGPALAELGRAFLPGFQEKRRELRDARKALGQAAYAADMSAFFQLTPKEQNAIIDYKTARDNAMMLGGQQPGLGEALGQEVIRLHEVFGDRYDMKRIDELAETWGRYQNAQITEEIREMGQRQGQGDTATKALASGASILTKMAGDWTAPLGHLMDLASSTGRYGGFDENSLGSAFDVYTDSVRGAVAEDIRGDGQNGWRNAASYLYQNGMSAADILASIGLYKNYSNIVSGIGAFGDTITDASAKDASYGEALALAGADALITAGVNKLPFDALLDTASGAPKKALEIPGDILKQIGAQVGAGTLTNLGNEALERYILQEDSAYGQEIDFNMREGMSYEEAKQAADKAFWKRMADNALNRVVTGAFSSTGAMAYSYANKAYNDWRDRAELSEIEGQPAEEDAELTQGLPENDISPKSDETLTLKNAAGHEIIKVEKTDITGEPGSITQYVARKGGIDRNYYGDDGRQYKQITNNDHGQPKKHPYGKHGEHVHDYIYDKTGKLIDRPARELTDLERKENEDIL